MSYTTLSVWEPVPDRGFNSC